MIRMYTNNVIRVIIIEHIRIIVRIIYTNNSTNIVTEYIRTLNEHIRTYKVTYTNNVRTYTNSNNTNIYEQYSKHIRTYTNNIRT